MGRYKKYLAILLMFSIHMMPFSAFAGAAEKWEYEPIQKDMNIKVKAYKVDQYGDAINDKKYEIKIDPKTTANKKLMGGVGIAKLLKRANWASVGVEAVQYLLEGIDWVIDPAAQSIWRYKEESSCIYCIYKLEITVKGSTQKFSDTKLAEAEVERLTGRSREEYDYRWKEIRSTAGELIAVELFIFLPDSEADLGKYAHGVVIEPIPAERPKELLTAEALADYMLGTHKDFANSKYKDKLPEPKTWTDVENVWKPQNAWEYENSPTVREVVRELEQANPVSEDSEVITKPDPETGLNNFTLPAFCSWATPVCTAITDFKKWANEEPDTDTEIDIDQETEQPVNSTFKFSKDCPASIPLVFSWNGGQLDFTFNFSMLCDVLSTYIYPIVVALGGLHAVYIVSGVRRDG